jgi:arylsulfatase
MSLQAADQLHRKFSTLSTLGGALLLAACLAPSDAGAQQIHGTPGAPSSTITLDGKVLPPPDQPFKGEIQLNASQSKPYWPMRVTPPPGAPNVLLILIDDEGFGAPSTFGGVIPTPTLDKVAAQGLRYTNFHTTSLCSPTRAALITGRNHHSVGFGVVSEQSTGFPGYNSIIPKDSATIGRVLLENGYRTSWFGKNHNTPTYTAIQAARSTNGRPAWASNISMASSAATPASGSRTCSATPPRSSPIRAIRNGTSSPPWRMTRSIGWTS